jgi:phage gpG-like protein
VAVSVTIHTVANREDILKALRELPDVATGESELAQAMMTRIGLTVLGRIRHAFIVKARGGTDEAGNRWAPLRPYTIAMRGVRGNSKTARAERKRRLQPKNFSKYSARTVEILRDTGALLNSLTPLSASSSQVFDVAHAGSVTIGTNLAYAAAHHEGDPRRNLPQRRLWPDPNDWPPTWWQDIHEQATQGIVEIATRLVEDAT